jgi:hypothetical protein
MEQVSVPLDASRDVVWIIEMKLNVDPLKIKPHYFPSKIEPRNIVVSLILSVVLRNDVHVQLRLIEIKQGIHLIKTSGVPCLVINSIRVIIVLCQKLTSWEGNNSGVQVIGDWSWVSENAGIQEGNLVVFQRSVLDVDLSISIDVRYFCLECLCWCIKFYGIVCVNVLNNYLRRRYFFGWFWIRSSQDNSLNIISGGSSCILKLNCDKKCSKLIWCSRFGLQLTSLLIEFHER